MKKVKQFTLLFILSIGLFACETESIDQKITEEGVYGEPILRFDLNGETRIVTGDNISVALGSDNLIHITAIIRDQYNNYNPSVLRISFTNRYGPDQPNEPVLPVSAETGTYPTALNHITYTNRNWSKASFQSDVMDWQYSTENVRDTEVVTRDRGSLVIEAIREQSYQIEGSFRFDMFLPEEAGTVNNSIKIENGYFKYLNI